MFLFSSGKNAKTVVELTNQICTLIEESKQIETQETTQVAGSPLLVGKCIKHSFEDGVYSGRVVSVVPGFPKWFNVKYDNDPAIYVYPLQEDYKKGNLTIVVGRYKAVWNFTLLFCLVKIV